jgi:hypothetical protein
VVKHSLCVFFWAVCRSKSRSKPEAKPKPNQNQIKTKSKPKPNQNTKPQSRAHRLKSLCGNLDFHRLYFFVEALNLSCFNKSGNRKGMWKSIFATSHTDSEACATGPSRASTTPIAINVTPQESQRHGRPQGRPQKMSRTVRPVCICPLRGDTDAPFRQTCSAIC